MDQGGAPAGESGRADKPAADIFAAAFAAVNVSPRSATVALPNRLTSARESPVCWRNCEPPKTQPNSASIRTHNLFVIILWRGRHPIVRSARSGASDCKIATGHLPGGQAMESMGSARHEDVSRRPALLISHIASHSLLDISANNVGPAFSARGPGRLFRPRQPFSSNRAVCLEPSSDPARGPSTYNKPKYRRE
jgi:hypothetical protein